MTGATVGPKNGVDSEVETADDADGTDKAKLGAETCRLSPNHATQTKPA